MPFAFCVVCARKHQSSRFDIVVGDWFDFLPLCKPPSRLHDRRSLVCRTGRPLLQEAQAIRTRTFANISQPDELRVQLQSIAHRIRELQGARQNTRVDVSSSLSNQPAPTLGCLVGYGVRVAKSHLQGGKAGNGLFAERHFVAGEMITFMSGDKVDDAQARRLLAARRDSHLCTLSSRHVHLDGVRDARRAACAASALGGASFANDGAPDGSINNAVYAQVAHNARDSLKRVLTMVLRARRPIEPGEEILVSYGRNYWHRRGVELLPLPSHVSVDLLSIHRTLVRCQPHALQPSSLRLLFDSMRTSTIQHFLHVNCGTGYALYWAVALYGAQQATGVQGGSHALANVVGEFGARIRFVEQISNQQPTHILVDDDAQSEEHMARLIDGNLGNQLVCLASFRPDTYWRQHLTRSFTYAASVPALNTCSNKRVIAYVLYFK